MEIRVQEAALPEAVLVSGILTEAALWLRDRGIPWLLPEEVTASRLGPEVQAGLFFLAWSGRVAVGTMRLTPSDPLFWPEAEPGEALYLHRLAVRRAAAGGRVSSALMSWARSRAGAQGARYLRLDCEASRGRLRAVYERFGFAFHSERTVGSFVVARYQLLCTHAA